MHHGNRGGEKKKAQRQVERKKEARERGKETR